MAAEEQMGIYARQALGTDVKKRAHDEVARDGINSFPPHRELTDDERCAEAARIASPRSRSHEEVTQVYQDLKARFKESPKERAAYSADARP